jgi:RHS repeat-associated protein
VPQKTTMMKTIRHIRIFLIATAMMLTCGTLLRGQFCEIDYIDVTSFNFDAEGSDFDEGIFVVTTFPDKCFFMDPGAYDWVYFDILYDDEWSNDVTYQVYCDPNEGAAREAYLYLNMTDYIYVSQEAGGSPPDTPGTITGPTTSLCPQVSGYEFYINTVEDATSYTWSVPTGWSITAGQGDTLITVTTGQTTGSSFEISVYASNDDGESDPSTIGSLTINAAPAITSHPSALSVCQEDPAQMSVTATGHGLTYQWRLGGNDIAGATSAQWSTQSAQSSHQGVYRVLVSGTCNTTGILSQEASLTVNPTVQITTQPVSAAVFPGGSAEFSVAATGSNLTYQWEKDGVEIPDSTGLTLSINSAGSQHTGLYRVKVSGLCSQDGVYSNTASLSFHSSDVTPTDTIAHMVVVEPTMPVGTQTLLDTLPQGALRQTINYFDGTGRITQSVQAGASPAHNDIVQLHSYDKMGRETEKLLPFTMASNNGAMVADAQSAQSSFYNSLFPGEGSYAKEITHYENSPMSRTLSQTAPGAAWQSSGNEKSVTYSYSTNQAGEVLLFTVDGNTLIYNHNNHYPAGILRKVTVTDSNHDGGTNPLNSTIEFRNAYDELVLRRTLVEGDNEQTDIIDTYYVHDQRGQLRYTITPEAVARLGTATQFTSESDLIKNLCYYYQYDNRGRLVIKQLPGAAPEYMVYDIRDRVVLRQDGNMRSANKWHFTKYDAHNREAVTGLLTTATAISRQTMQTDVDNAYIGQSPRDLWIERSDASGTIMGYTVESFPNSDDGTIEYLTATWYDSYGFPGALSFSTTHDISDDSFVTDPAGYNKEVAGLVTGRALRILGTSEFVTTTNYYDDLYRVIQTRQDLYDGTQGGSNEVVSQKFDFSGKLLESRQVQLFDSQTLVVTEERTYDHAGRLLKRTHKTGGRDAVVLAQMEYNELGQLSEKSLHETATDVFMQQIDYSYNIRGWMTSMNNPDNIGNDLFAIRLLYDDVSQLSPLDSVRAQFNGNIAGVIWHSRTDTASAGILKAYSYIYDANNRITESYYGAESGGNLVASQNYREYGYSYDLNGNILSLSRTNSAGLLIDSLYYDYGSGSNYSNRLLNVTDNASQPAGFNDNHTSAQYNDFEYDPNGSMNIDRNKGIDTIEYNFLNLPRKVEKDANNYIEYLYDASARKVMQRVVTSGVATERFYHNGFEYGASGIELVHTGEGVVNVSTTDNNHRYNYFLKDHLGSTRVVFGEDTQGELIVNQVTDYYAFGLAHEPGFGMGDTRYLYNGKELQDELDLGQSLSLGWLDYGWRMYDPQIGRWHVIDPLTEKYSSYSPYNYVLNNPVRYIDPDGREPSDVGDEGSIIVQDDEGNQYKVDLSWYQEVLSEFSVGGSLVFNMNQLAANLTAHDLANMKANRIQNAQAASRFSRFAKGVGRVNYGFGALTNTATGILHYIDGDALRGTIDMVQAAGYSAALYCSLSGVGIKAGAIIGGVVLFSEGVEWVLFDFLEAF